MQQENHKPRVLDEAIMKKSVVANPDEFPECHTVLYENGQNTYKYAHPIFESS